MYLISNVAQPSRLCLKRKKQKKDYDKIEFFNPGGYPKPIEYFLQNDTSIPRNPILARLFRAVKLAENAGYGFDKMIEGWKTYSKDAINFKTDLDTSTTIFYLPTEPASDPASDPGSDPGIVKFCNEPKIKR